MPRGGTPRSREDDDGAWPLYGTQNVRPREYRSQRVPGQKTIAVTKQKNTCNPQHPIATDLIAWILLVMTRGQSQTANTPMSFTLFPTAALPIARDNTNCRGFSIYDTHCPTAGQRVSVNNVDMHCAALLTSDSNDKLTPRRNPFPDRFHANRSKTDHRPGQTNDRNHRGKLTFHDMHGASPVHRTTSDCAKDLRVFNQPGCRLSKHARTIAQRN